MIAGKAFGSVVATLAGVTGAAVVTPPAIAPSNIAGPALYDLLGFEVPILPVIIGVLTALLVRVITMSSSPQKLISYNVAVTLLAMIGTATFIIDHRTGPGISFWVGAGFGAVGVGIVQIAKSKAFGSIVDGARAGLAKAAAENEEESRQDDPPPR